MTWVTTSRNGWVNVDAIDQMWPTVVPGTDDEGTMCVLRNGREVVVPDTRTNLFRLMEAEKESVWEPYRGIDNPGSR